MNNFQKILDHIRETSTTKTQQGKFFEDLIQKFLAESPEYNHKFQKVQKYASWARKNNLHTTDIGVDLVGTDYSGNFHAIQCKCYDPESYINKDKIDTFLAEAGGVAFNGYVLVHTANIGKHAEKTLKNFGKPGTVIDFQALSQSMYAWPDPTSQKGSDLKFIQKPHEPKKHQKEALKKIREGFQNHDKGQLIMPCGTGKTFVSLKTAEAEGIGKTVLLLVPSISLLSQSLREFSIHKSIPHRYIGICSDSSAGRDDEDIPIQELAIPVSTDPENIRKQLEISSPDALTVIFCTYHSLPLLRDAIRSCKKQTTLDLAICDEAHRTAGNTDSRFRLIHNNQAIPAKKRLFMTATPRTFTEKDSISMNDPTMFGPRFYRLKFSQAVHKNLLSDYKVVVLTVDDSKMSADLQEFLAENRTTSNLRDSLKIHGTWNAMQDPEDRRGTAEPIKVTKAIAFCTTIANSRALCKHMPKICDPQQASMEIRHIDGKTNAFNRKTDISWLDQKSIKTRILTNARCLSEGIDVPALDAVVFMNPRRSKTDIVQSVGRVMRKAPDKKIGYVIIPVVILKEDSVEDSLSRNEDWQPVWDVLRALRSHDDTLANEIELMRMGTASSKILFHTSQTENRAFQNIENDLCVPPELIIARLVEKCGDRKYWKSWAQDVACNHRDLLARIADLRNSNSALEADFQKFRADLKLIMNDQISTKDCMSILAQHIITKPVFQSLFSDYGFIEKNPVSIALNGLEKLFDNAGLDAETRHMQEFYEEIANRVKNLTQPEQKQALLKDLYQDFFAEALKEQSTALGVVYTPNEIINFIIHSTNDICQKELGKSLTEKDVAILDPFTGTGTFLVQLINSGLLDKNLAHKYEHELFANEYMLLAYYIACVNIEMAFHARSKSKTYTPFKNINLTDTFAVNQDSDARLPGILTDSDIRLKRQIKQEITAIMGNPPWGSQGRIKYKELDKSIRETYVKESKRLTDIHKHHLLDKYKSALRWSSNRIGDKGVVAFITNNGFLTTLSDAGIRYCLQKEFSSIYIVNLRGDLRKGGFSNKSEGESVFNIMQGTSIIVMVKNPDAKTTGKIYYYETEDFMSREEKLELLTSLKSIDNIQFREICPDQKHNWFGAISQWPDNSIPLISYESKEEKTQDAIFQAFSNGHKTSNDAKLYDFSKASLKEKITASLAEPYNAQKETKVLYKAFCKKHFYRDYSQIQRRMLTENLFPERKNNQSHTNLVVLITHKMSTDFSVLASNMLSDQHTMGAGQACPFWFYPEQEKFDLFTPPPPPHGDRRENITEFALKTFQNFYQNPKITKMSIFQYVYGVLHSKTYIEKYAFNLTQEFPRIPLAKNFEAFRKAGESLIDLHTNYETGPRTPISIRFAPGKSRQDLKFTERRQALSPVSEDGFREIAVNPDVILEKIPEQAFQYSLNGKSALEWFMNQHQIKKLKHNKVKTGYVADPNTMYSTPNKILACYERLLYLSLETVKIVNALPDPLK